MKFVTLLLIAFASVLGHADCPDLSGTYFCKKDAPNLPDIIETVRQEKVGLFWHYTFDDKNADGSGKDDQMHTYITDGMARDYVQKGGYKGPDGDLDQDLPYSAVATCTDTYFTIELYINVAPIGAMQARENFQLTPDGDLVTEIATDRSAPRKAVCTRM